MTEDLKGPSDRGSSPVGPGSALGRLKSGPFPLLALVLIVAAAVRLVGIGQQSFSSDEMYELRVAHAGIADILTFGDGIPPLYNLLVHILVPLGDLAGRVLSALCGVATVGIAWAWARRIAGIRVGIYAAWLVALSPLAVQLSGEGRAYALMAMLAATSLWSLWVALDSPSTLRWVRWGLVSALGIYTHYLFAVLVVAWLLIVLVEARGRLRREMWVGIGTLALLAAPAVALLLGDKGVHPHAGLNAAEAAYAGYRLIAGLSLGPSSRDLLGAGIIEAIKAAWMWVAVLAPPVGLMLVQGYRALDRVARRRLLALLVSGLLLELAVIQVTGLGFGPSYVTWLVVPLAVWLAVGLVHLRPRWRWASAAVLLVVAVISLVATYLDPHHQVDDARGVAAYLESSGALDHPVLVSDETRARPIAYYLDRPLALALPDQWDPEIGRLGSYPDEQLGLTSIPRLEEEGFGLTEALRLVDARTRAGEPYHLVYTLSFYGDPHGELLATLTTRDGLTLVQSFPGMDVYRGVRAG